MRTDGERLATIEQVLQDLRGDVGDVRAEQERTRGRLHKLESTMQGLTILQRERIEQQDRLFKTLGLRLKWLSFAISLAGVIVAAVSLIVHFH